MKAYSYLRFSTPEQLKGDSFRRQTDLAAAYALQHGLDLDTELRFADKGVSAFRGQNAATGALKMFLRAIEDGDIDPHCYLLVESLDRISRSAILEAQGLFQLILNTGVTLVTLADSKVYSYESVTANPTDLILSMLVMIRAHEESQTKSKRLKQAWIGKRAKVSLGETLLTSKVPGWLQIEGGAITVIEERAAVVRRIFSLTLDGQGKETIARTFNEEGIQPFGRASHWHASYVHKIQTNPAVIGTLSTSTLEHVNGKAFRQPSGTVDGYYPPIVDPETFSRVQSLKVTTTKTKGKAPVQSILAGLATCHVCGSRMTRVMKGSGSKAGKPYLVCSKAKLGKGCEYKAVRLDYVEATIRHSYVDLQEALSAYGFEGLAREVDNLEASEMGGLDRIEELVDTITEMGRSPALTKRLRELENELEATRKAIKEKRSLMGSRSLAARLEDLQKALEEGTPATANTALRELFSSVIVDYETGYLDLKAHSGAKVSIMYRWVD
jgi:DNA invertase Pin-like site-specific DNA recombinase